MSSVPPLMALTESGQKGRTTKAKGKAKSTHGHVPRRRFEKKQTISFDEDARREYLTGFSKRKQQRKQAAHEFVQKKIREEIKKSRQAAAEARKQRAAENVRAERRAYGLDTDDEDEEEEEAPAPMNEERDFENEERYAHVTIQEMGMDDWTTPAPFAEVLPPSSRRAAKKEDAQPAPVASKKAKAESRRTNAISTVPSGSLTGILEPEVAQAAQSEQIFSPTDVPEQPKTKRAHTYLSKAERQKERQKQREWNHAQAEKRRAENKVKATHVKKKKRATM
ncbi:rRNA binding protein [Malassezia pachydermatis]|uniref:Nucleolar protein 12 n=1 Tax=Malassezia pachydermatis TaxID=77020 RepID=A0A0M9VP16_9BASI|nr:hypothetical protein Malapachy_4110 [Malassezia pachydermatis]KOS13949.1 hypothetical protein Malapachy_4110 [Malassezia pachydermatis]